MPGTEVPGFGSAERAPPPSSGFHMPELPPKHSLEALELADLHHPNCKINRKVCSPSFPLILLLTDEIVFVLGCWEGY